MLTFKNKIEILCYINNVSFSSVASKLGIARSSLAKWDNSTPVKETVENLAHYFHVPIDSLLDNNDSMLIELLSKKESEDQKIIMEFAQLLYLLRLSRPASEVAKDVLISIKRNIDM